MTAADILRWAGIITAVCAAIVGLYKAHRHVWPTIRGVLRLLFRAHRIEHDLTQIGNKLDFLVKELTPNGGGSMRDAITRIDNMMTVNEQRQRAALTITREALMEVDAQGNCIWANQTYLQLTGRPLDEILGRGWVNTISSVERETVMEEFDNALDEGREFEYEYTISIHGKDRARVAERTTRLRDRKGSIVGYIRSVYVLEES